MVFVHLYKITKYLFFFVSFTLLTLKLCHSISPLKLECLCSGLRYSVRGYKVRAFQLSSLFNPLLLFPTVHSSSRHLIHPNSPSSESSTPILSVIYPKMAIQLPPRPAVAAAFLASLPILKLDELPEHSRICHICKDDFSSDKIRNPDEDNDIPVKLPCNHIMGSACLATWLNINNSCPLCRATLCDQQASFLTIFSQLSEAELAILSQRSTETLREVNALDADVDAVLRISNENADMIERLIELQLGPQQTREQWEEARGLHVRLVLNHDLMADIEGRVRGLSGRLGRVEVEVLGILGLRGENGAARE